VSITYREICTHGSYVTGLLGQTLAEATCNTNSSRKHCSLWEQGYRNQSLRGQEVKYRHAAGAECTSLTAREAKDLPGPYNYFFQSKSEDRV